MSEYQSYLKDCECNNSGIILHDGKACCRWCRKPYAKGGCLFYEPNQFPKEKDMPKWEILSFVDHCTTMADGKKRIIYWQSNCAMKREDWVSRWLDAGFKINAVIRLADNITFTLGDNTDFGVIKEFALVYNNLMFVVTDKGSCISLMDIQKVDKKWVLFTTIDGVEIYSQETFWYKTDDWKSASTRLVNYEHWDKRLPSFSTKEKCDEYILLNKPILVSYKELRDFLNTKYDCNLLDDYTTLKQFFQSKINT